MSRAYVGSPEGSQASLKANRHFYQPLRQPRERLRYPHPPPVLPRPTPRPPPVYSPAVMVLFACRRQFHDGLGFLLSHTILTNTFESSLQLVNPKLTVPYWDFTIETSSSRSELFDPSKPTSRSPLLQESWFGGYDEEDYIVSYQRGSLKWGPQATFGTSYGDGGAAIICCRFCVLLFHPFSGAASQIFYPT